MAKEMVRPRAHWAAIQDAVSCIGAKRRSRQSDKYMVAANICTRTLATRIQQFRVSRFIYGQVWLDRRVNRRNGILLRAVR